MTVAQLIGKLTEYNMKADVQVVVRDHSQPFEICFGGADGGTKQTALTVCFVVDGSSEAK